MENCSIPGCSRIIYYRSVAKCKICYHRDYHLANKEKHNKRSLEQGYKYRDKTRARDELRKNDLEWKRQKAAYDQSYRDLNRERLTINHRHTTAHRRAKKLQATPLWVDRKALKQIYDNCPKGMHVDHIVPLVNKDVCGLHVPWNLQYLTPKDNASKGNKFNGSFQINSRTEIGINSCDRGKKAA